MAVDNVFVALCRFVGIPARTTGGHQMITGNARIHFQAEYYLEGYGWIPVDVTVVKIADWSYNATPEERHKFKHISLETSTRIATLSRRI